MHVTGVAVSIFCLTYALIASRRLRLLPIGRPAGALLGAVLMVASGVLSPEASYEAVDGDTIVLLFGMMLITAHLEEAGFFDLLAAGLLRAGGSPWRLLWTLSVASAALSAFLVNDTVCLFLTPVVVAACRRGGLPMGPYLIALATSANLGSAATLVGNPQNMIVGSLSGLSFVPFLLCAGPAAAAGVAINVALLALYYRRGLPARVGGDAPEPPRIDRRRLRFTLAAAAGVVAGFFAGFHLGYTTLAGAMVLVLADRKEPRGAFAKVDWPLLVFFCCLFIVVGGLASTGLPEAAWSAASPYFRLAEARGAALFTALMVLGSNVFSNVPMVLLTGPHLGELGSEALGWTLLAFTTTVAGNLTLVGSVANIIVAEGARDDYALGFVEYLRFGAVSTLLALAAGVPILYLLAEWAYGPGH